MMQLEFLPKFLQNFVVLCDGLNTFYFINCFPAKNYNLGGSHDNFLATKNFQILQNLTKQSLKPAVCNCTYRSTETEIKTNLLGTMGQGITQKATSSILGDAPYKAIMHGIRLCFLRFSPVLPSTTVLSTSRQMALTQMFHYCHYEQTGIEKNQ